MIDGDISFYEKDALLYRLLEGLENSDKDVVFVVGAPLTAPYSDFPGVADVSGVVDLIRGEFSGKNAQLEKLDTALAGSPNAYQTAFDFLSPRAGQDAANRVIKRAVAQALVANTSGNWNESINKLSEEDLRNLDANPSSWHLTPAVAALGSLIAKFPNRFGQILLTSNFDPLVEIAINQSGGNAWRTSLSVDGSINQSTASGCHVIHIHGFWHGSDTLHTNRQLLRNRPTLKNDLLLLLQNKIVVVIAYGGWPDIFTGALGGVVSNDNLFPEILWTFFGESPSINEHLYKVLQPGIDRNRVTFYKGINCHEFFPELLNLWSGDSADEVSDFGPASSIAGNEAPHAHDRAKLFRLAPLECDRPPNVEVWVGRENELRALETSSAKVVIFCGIGGEGKSALAAHYIANLKDREGRYRLWDWRDCKEQGDRIRTQIIEIIARFSNCAITAEHLTDAKDAEIVEILIEQTKDANAVLVFDNVDSYVDLENQTFTGMLDQLVQRLAACDSSSRIVLTCRPDVQYPASSVITFSMKGISEEEAVELFAKRTAIGAVPENDIREAHALTKGHAFWLDLLAVQVTKVPGTTLRKLLNDMRRGREDVPDVLSSIWDKLALREQTLLRFMAEAVRPETEKTIERFASSQLTYKNFSRALKSLISLNLIVVKPEVDAPDLYDLHPLVRQFVRTTFEPAERTSFIRVVLNQYEVIIGAFGNMLGIHMPFPMLERWSQKAELEVSAGLYEEAFETLVKVEDALIGGGHVQEYVRVGRLLFEEIDWESAATQYKRFDKVVGIMVRAFEQLGDTTSADALIQRYEGTIPQKTARYISYCDVKAYSCWLRGEFREAVEWASQGVSLKNETNVDTNFDCSHTLALAQRDFGQPSVAIEYFRKGFPISDIISSNANVPADGPMFGNVGRCLQFMGQLDDALACYTRSMKLLEHGSSSDCRSNRAYARSWVGEILATKGEKRKAIAFFSDAIRILGKAAPIRVRNLYSEIDKLKGTEIIDVSDDQANRIVTGWMRNG